MKPTAPAFKRLARVATCRDFTIAPDGELLRSFIADHDSDAFAALVNRHGPMVLGLCQRLTRDNHAADDAFQAVFLSLSRKAGTIRRPESLPAWLFGVAHRIALKARAERERRKTVPPGDVAGVEVDPLVRMSARELIDALDIELARLPLNYRSAILLCTIDGKTIEDAARQLGATTGAVRGWLQRGRDRLKDRLARRGLTLPAALTAGILPPSTAVEASLAKVAIQLANSGADVPRAIAALVQGGLSICSKWAALILLAACSAGIGVSLLPGAAPPRSGAEPKKSAEDPPTPKSVKIDGPPVDRLGDPLPKGVLARLGTLRFRHGSTVDCIAFSGDNRLLVSGGYDGFVNIWDVSTGQPRLRVSDPNFPDHRFGAAVGVALSPDNTQLAVAWVNSPPALWDVRTGKKLRDLGDRINRANIVMFSDDGQYLITNPYDIDFPAIVAEVATGKVIFSAPGKLLSLKGHFIHVDPIQHEISLHKLGHAEICRLFKGHEGNVTAAVLANDQKTLFTHSTDRTIRVWNTATGKELHRLDRAPVSVRVLATAPDAKSILTVSGDGSSMQCREVESGDVRWTAKVDAKGHSYVHASFLPGGKTIVTGHDDGRLRLWDIRTGKEQKVVHAHYRSDIRRLVLSPDGLTLATTANGSNDTMVHLWDTAALTPKTDQQGHTQSITAAVFSPDGRIVATSGAEGSIRLWQSHTGNPIRTLETATSTSPFFTPDGKTLITGARTGERIHFWDVETGKESRRLNTDPKGQFVLAVSPDATRIITGSSDHRLRCWDATSFKQLSEFADDPPSMLLRGELSPDGSTLATTHLDQVLRVWDARTFKKRYQLVGGLNSHIGAIAFSPDNSLLAWSDDVAGIRLTNVASGAEVRRIPCRANSFDGIVFAPDGKTIAWGVGQQLPAAPNAVQVWEVRTGELRRTLNGHDGPAAPVAFSPRGDLLVTAGSDGSALVWDMHGRHDNKKQATANPSPEKLAIWWDALAVNDAAKAFECMEMFSQFPEQTVALIAERLKPIPRPSAAKVAGLLRDLESDKFKIRDAATRELESLDEAVTIDLRQLAKKSSSVEACDRAERLLARIDSARLQRERSIETLEMIGTPSAAKLLESLAEGQADAPLTRDARGALSRVKQSRPK